MKQMLTINAGLREYQERAVRGTLKWLNEKPEESSLLIASPTGTGKSLIAMTLLNQIPDALLLTPRLEIVAGMLEKCGVDTSLWSQDRLAAEALRYGISTPLRIKSVLAGDERLSWRPGVVIWDEAHHRTCDSWAVIREYLPDAREVGLTATPFRGTAASTSEFREMWNAVKWAIDIGTAAEEGYISLPRCEVWPLGDDDTVEVSNGEITVRAASDLVRPRLADVVERCAKYRNSTTGQWDRATIFSVPSGEVAGDLATRLNDAGLPARTVTKDTPRSERVAIFAACERAEVAIVQINVVSEGVDLKLRRLIDLAPTLSPVKWVQQLGRVTRPGDVEPEYICCTRNLERHCYLYDGLIPPEVVRASQEAFGGPSKRAGVRVLGLEKLGKFAAAELPLNDGAVGMMYSLTAPEGMRTRYYTVLIHPCSPRPIYATRTSASDGEQRTWGKWVEIASLPDLTGFASKPAKAVSEKQMTWWTNAADMYNLDGGGCVNQRNFQALPVLADIGRVLSPHKTHPSTKRGMSR